MDQTKLLADASNPLGFFQGLGFLGGDDGADGNFLVNPANAFGTFTQVLSTIIGVITIIGIIWFIFVLFTGAISWLASGGDKTKVQNAQKQITNGLIGLIILFSAIFIVRLIGELFGISITDIGGMLGI
jgi:hypothetical protein